MSVTLFLNWATVTILFRVRKASPLLREYLAVNTSLHAVKLATHIFARTAARLQCVSAVLHQTVAIRLDLKRTCHIPQCQCNI